MNYLASCRSAVGEIGTLAGRHVFRVILLAESEEGGEVMSGADIAAAAVSSNAPAIVLEGSRASRVDPAEFELYDLVREAHLRGLSVFVITKGEEPPRLSSGDFTEEPDGVVLAANAKSISANYAWMGKVTEVVLELFTEDGITEGLTKLSELIVEGRLEVPWAGVPVFFRNALNSNSITTEIKEAVQLLATPWGGELIYQP